MNKYIGHHMQLWSVQEYRLTGGKGDGMRMLRVKNQTGLDFEISLDRAADISTLSVNGVNMSYISPCGYVSPKYYDKTGAGFLKSFTAGFFTTCGLTAVGGATIDNGEELPMHGNISNTPAENASYWEEDGNIHIKAIIRDASAFSHKLILEREYICPIAENVIYLKDKIKNIGSFKTPYQILYHCNMGYPLLTENAVVTIPSSEVKPRDEHAGADIDNCLNMEKPQRDYQERCYYHKMTGDTFASIYNPDIKKGVRINYNADELKYFTQWKMMGEGEYVLGLEPGNCTPDGRCAHRANNTLEFLNAGEEKNNHIKFEFVTE